MIYGITGILIAALISTAIFLLVRRKFDLSNKRERWAHDSAILFSTPIPLLLLTWTIRNDGGMYSGLAELTNELSAKIIVLIGSCIATVLICTLVAIILGWAAFRLAGPKHREGET